MAKKKTAHPKRTKPSKPHDAFFKKSMSKLALARLLFQLLLPEEVAEGIDWATLQPAKDSLVTKKLKRLNLDLLYTVRYFDNTELMLMLVIEHKSGTPLLDDVIELKLMEYEFEVYQAVVNQRKEENQARRKVKAPAIEQPFPNMSTVVVHHGRSPWNAPDWQQRRGLNQLPANKRPRGMRYTYYLHDLSRMTNEEVLAFYKDSAELLVMALLMKHSHNKSLNKLEELLLLARDIKTAQDGFELFHEVSEYMLTFTEPENYDHVIEIAGLFDPHLKNDVMTIAEAFKLEGEIKGKAEGLNLSRLIAQALRAGKDVKTIAHQYQVPLQDVVGLKEAMGL